VSSLSETSKYIWYIVKVVTDISSIWYSANGLALILGSLLSYGLAQIEGTSLKPYQWIFLMSGIIALLFAIPTMLILPSHPTTAKFLSDEQKYIALERIRLNNTGTQNTRMSCFRYK